MYRTVTDLSSNRKGRKKRKLDWDTIEERRARHKERQKRYRQQKKERKLLEAQLKQESATDSSENSEVNDVKDDSNIVTNTNVIDAVITDDVEEEPTKNPTNGKKMKFIEYTSTNPRRPKRQKIAPVTVEKASDKLLPPVPPLPISNEPCTPHPCNRQPHPRLATQARLPQRHRQRNYQLEHLSSTALPPLHQVLSSIQTSVVAEETSWRILAPPTPAPPRYTPGSQMRVSKTPMSPTTLPSFSNICTLAFPIVNINNLII